MRYWLKVVVLMVIAFGFGTVLRYYVMSEVSVGQSIDVQINVVEREKLPDVIRRVKSGVVHIQCPNWQGSGFVVGSNLIATARHCVEGVEDFIITTDDGHKLHATRAISSKEYDVAFIYVDDLTCVANERGTLAHEVELSPLELGSIMDCQLGQQVFAVGSLWQDKL